MFESSCDPDPEWDADVDDEVGGVRRRPLSGVDAAAFYAACAELQRRVLPIARRSTPEETRAAALKAVLAIQAEEARSRRFGNDPPPF